MFWLKDQKVQAAPKHVWCQGIFWEKKAAEKTKREQSSDKMSVCLTGDRVATD
jgi:hypothetical protein